MFTWLKNLFKKKEKPASPDFFDRQFDNYIRSEYDKGHRPPHPIEYVAPHAAPRVIQKQKESPRSEFRDRTSPKPLRVHQSDHAPVSFPPHIYDSCQSSSNASSSSCDSGSSDSGSSGSCD